MWPEIGGSRLDQFTYIPAKGSTGDIIIGWNNVLLIGRIEKVREFSLTVNSSSKKDNFNCRYTTMYRPTTMTLKHAFWEELCASWGEPHFLWIFCE